MDNGEWRNDNVMELENWNNGKLSPGTGKNEKMELEKWKNERMEN